MKLLPAVSGSLRSWVRQLPLVRRLGPAVGRWLGPLWLDNPDGLRCVLARKFITGAGIEIGALNQPQTVRRSAQVQYVDRMPLDQLQAHYPNVRGMRWVDIVDDGEALHTVSDGSQDFVIANHFLEHAQNPIGTLRRFLSVVRPGGVVFLAVPDMRGTFDWDRPLTTLAHLFRDDAEGAAWSYQAHIEEFVYLAMRQSGAEAEATIEHFRRTNYSIHYHVWTHDSFGDLLRALQPRLGFSVLAHVYSSANSETVCVLQKA